jgi:alginate O-acetyltransferase complex protein AlgI
MLFNTIQYAIFLPVVFVLYWFVTARYLRLQNILLLVSSYYFYACWDYRFLALLMFSTLLDYATGLKMGAAGCKKQRRFWLWLSIGINLGFLGVFKYYNFFAGSLSDVFNRCGMQAGFVTLHLVLPVGISFYTFHGLSYVLDIYKGKIKPVGNFVDYAVFVSFFPLLVAGPIERATHLLPQIRKERTFNYVKAVDGMRQILWGLFKKVVIADNCANFVNVIFENSANSSGSTLLIAALLFAFQIYCDFSGYSDIALGSARLFGIELLRNFAFPYFSRDIAEFWRRWHISLSSWFRDYVYIPLGGSKGGTWTKVRNTFVIFLVSGLWHGANWTFVVWGGLNAAYFLPLLLMKRNRVNLEVAGQGRVLPTVGEMIQIVVTFGMTTVAWIFFRAKSVRQAVDIVGRIASSSLLKRTEIGDLQHLLVLLACIVVFVMIEWLGREKQYALAGLELRMSRPLRWSIYYAVSLIVLFFAGQERQFIYFQF